MRHCLDCASDNSSVSGARVAHLVQTRCGDVKTFVHFERQRETACGDIETYTHMHTLKKTIC